MGVKEQKVAQNEIQELHPSRATSQEQYSLRSWFLLHLCKMMISSGVLFIFLYFHFWAVRGVKGQKMTQDDKKISLLQLISQEPYIIWFSYDMSFMVHIWFISQESYTSYDFDLWYSCLKWKYLHGCFSFLKKCWFSGLWEGGRGGGGCKMEKIAKNDKNSVCCAWYLRNHTSYDCHLWYTSVQAGVF